MPKQILNDPQEWIVSTTAHNNDLSLLAPLSLLRRRFMSLVFQCQAECYCSGSVRSTLVS